MQSSSKHISFRSNKNRGSEYYIKTLKNKSTGPSSIPNKLFKQFKKPLSEPLTLLIKLIFSEGKFPSILKWIKSFLYAKKVAQLK